jgi:hypothetical protein
MDQGKLSSPTFAPGCFGRPSRVATSAPAPVGSVATLRTQWLPESQTWVRFTFSKHCPFRLDRVRRFGVDPECVACVGAIRRWPNAESPGERELCFKGRTVSESLLLCRARQGEYLSRNPVRDTASPTGSTRLLEDTIREQNRNKQRNQKDQRTSP